MGLMALTFGLDSRRIQEFEYTSPAQQVVFGAGSLDVNVSQGMCSGIGLYITGSDRNSGGSTTAFFGNALGLCCNTISQTYRFERTG